MVLTLLLVAVLSGYNAVATWTANPEPDIVGYKLKYGIHSTIYDTIIDTGKVTTYTVTNIQPGLYYFALTAYNAQLESAPSNEVVLQIPDPVCIFPTGAQAVSIFPTALQTTGRANSRARIDFQLASPGSPVVHVQVSSGNMPLSAMDGTALQDLAGMWFSVPAMIGTYPLTIMARNMYGCAKSQLAQSLTVIP